MKVNLNKYTNEVIVMVLALLIYAFAPDLIRFLDPTAGQFDGVYLQKLSFAAFGLAIGTLFCKVIVHISFRVIDNFLEDFSTHFNNLSLWERTKLSFLVSCFYLLVFSLLVIAHG